MAAAATRIVESIVIALIVLLLTSPAFLPQSPSLLSPVSYIQSWILF